MFHKITIPLLIFVIINSEGLNNIFVNGIDIIVDIPNVGKIQGSRAQTSWTKQMIMQFLGIPYAESPSHENRFLPPKSIPKWDAIRDAKNYGRVCPSKESLFNLTESQLEEDLEDCLNICVFTKNLSSDFPVMFYIHGGDFQSEDAHLYPPHYLLENDIVLVVPQYRIGHLGFASTQSDEIPGNVAILDIILALKWTKTNIKYFGGNPNNLTIFGQSSGAAITTLLLLSPIVPMALFQRAIFHSGSILQPNIIESNPINSSGEICKELGCTKCLEINDINQCLKNASIQKLINSEIPIGLTIQDKNGILPDMPKELMKRIKYTYPIIGGTTKHDGTVLFKTIYDEIQKLGQPIDQINPKTFLEVVIKDGCGPSDESGLILELTAKALFNGDDLENRDYAKLWPGMIDAVSVCNYKAPLLHFIELYSRNNSNSCYIFTFDYEGEYTRLNLNEAHYPFSGGAAHWNDLQYIFPWPTDTFNNKDMEVAKNMINIWTTFATTGIPTAIDGPELIKVNSSSSTMTYFKINDPITIGNNYMDEFTENDVSRSNIIYQMEITLIYLSIIKLII